MKIANFPYVPPSYQLILSGTLALTGSALFITAYPPWGYGLVTGWMILAPLVAAVTGVGLLRAGVTGWLFGFVANLGTFMWIFNVPGFRWYHFLILNSYLALYPALWSVCVARFRCHSISASVAIACTWVILDYVKGHAGFLGLPWVTLAQSQVDNTPLLQTARVFGESGVTFLVVLGNLAIWNTVKTWNANNAMLSALPVTTAMLLGTFALYGSATSSKPHVHIAALGTTFPAHEKASPSLHARFDTVWKFIDHQLPSGVEIVALPESALINPVLFPDQIDRLHQLARHKQITIVTGVAEAAKFAAPSTNFSIALSKLRSGALIITPDSDLPQTYEKSRLMPFAEEVPLREWIKWPTWLVPPLPEVLRGQAPRSYPVPREIRIGLMICWESLFAAHARTLTTEGSNLFLILSNEGWFGSTTAGALHNLTSRMRAAESHRSAAISSNMGPPLVIDPFGRIIGQGSADSPIQWVSAIAPLVEEPSLYTRTGDVFVGGAGIFLLIFLFTNLGHDKLAPNRSQHPPQPVKKG